MRFLIGLLVLAVTGICSAQEVTFEVLERNAIAGATVQVGLRMTSDGVVDDYQFDVCNGDLVTIEEVDFDRDALLSNLSFEIHIVELFDDGFTVDAIVAEVSELDGTDFELYQLTYTVGDELGTADLEFCGELLELEATVDGSTATATGEAGVIEIVEPGPDILRGDCNGDGFVTHLFDAYYVIVYAFAGGDAPPCFDAADVDNSGEVFGIIDCLALLQEQFGDVEEELPPPGDEECGPDPEAGDVGCETVPECPGTDDPLEAEPSGDYRLTIGTTVSVADTVSELELTLDNTGDHLGAFQFSICFDDEFLELEDGNVVFGEDAEALEIALYQQIEILSDRIDIVMLLNPLGGGYGSVLDAGEDLEFFLFFFEIDGNAEGVLPVEVCSDGTGHAPLVVTENVEAYVPVLVDGGFEISEGQPFIRGDVDGNGAVEGILDALAVLVWGFQDGDEPECMDAVDADDSGDVVAILEALFILEYVFTNGDFPPDPGPDECGVDPTEDDVDCEVSSDGCN